MLTTELEGVAGRNVEQVIADELQGLDAVVCRDSELVDGVDFVVEQRQFGDARHVDEGVATDRAQVRFLDAEQLLRPKDCAAVDQNLKFDSEIGYFFGCCCLVF